MPWEIVKRDDEYCVVKKDGGKTVACHPTEAAAKKHLAALYTNVPDAKAKYAVFDSHLGGVLTDGETVTRTGLLFRAGEYEDKNFSLTEDELAEAVADFSPVDLDLEHVPTVLDGRLGTADAVWARGSELFGSVTLPRWLDALLEDGERKVSCSWDRATKRIAGLSLVRAPRITDAALYSAFSADPAAAQFIGRRHSASDSSAIQQIHDLAYDQGAACKTVKSEMAAYSDGDRSGNGGGSDPGSHAQVHRDTHQKADPPPRRTRMSLRERLNAFFDKEEAEAGSSPPEPASSPPASAAAASPPPHAPSAGDAAAQFAATAKEQSDARVEALEKQIQKINAENRVKDAANFARQMIEQDKRAYPAEGEILAALYCQLMADDQNDNAQVTFSADGTKTGTRAEAFRALLMARPKHGLTEDLLKSATPEEKADFAALFNRDRQQAADDANKPMTPERRAELLKMTPIGEAIFSETASKNGGK